MRFLLLCLLFSTIQFTLAVVSVQAQTDAQIDKGQLLGKFTGGDIGEFNYRVIQQAAQDSLGKILVIRICSDRKLSAALASAPGIASSFGQPHGIVRMLKQYDIGIRTVYFARSSACAATMSMASTVEYWIVSDKSMLSVDEIKRSDEIQITMIYISSKSEFDSELKRFTSLVLGENSSGYILGGFNRRRSNQLEENVERSRKVAARTAPNSHVEVIYQKHDGILESGLEPAFPRLVVVELKALCLRGRSQAHGPNQNLVEGLV